MYHRPAIKLSVLLNGTSRELAKDLIRHISKTSTAPNSDTITRQQKTELNKTIPNKWIRLNRHNNNR